MAAGNAYLQRINATLDHARAHPDGDLSLATLAGVAGFSLFHFHRIFTGIVGETVHDFVAHVNSPHPSPFALRRCLGALLAL